MRTLYLPTGLAANMPRTCCVVNVAPLLRELILHAVSVGVVDSTNPLHASLIAVIVGQIEITPTIPLQLPLPHDHRARRVANALVRAPQDHRSLDTLAREAGASKRTIERLMLAETGMTFGRWRQQLRLAHALRRLAAGESVTTVAVEIGYESPSAFIAMFKRILGVTPGQYFNESS